MANLSKEQLAQIKGQLFEQIKSMPSDQQSSMKAQIESFNDEQLEEFLIQNKLVDPDNMNSDQQSPFRLIIENKIPSYKIAENNLAIAILELNPISKGHIIIIPKIASKSNNIKEEITNFAQIVGNYIKGKLKPKSIEIIVTEILGEGIVNVLPVYKKEDFNSKRSKASESELKDLQKLLMLPKEMPKPEIKKKVVKKKKIPTIKLPKYPRRQP